MTLLRPLHTEGHGNSRRDWRLRSREGDCVTTLCQGYARRLLRGPALVPSNQMGARGKSLISSDTEWGCLLSDMCLLSSYPHTPPLIYKCIEVNQITAQKGCHASLLALRHGTRLLAGWLAGSFSGWLLVCSPPSLTLVQRLSTPLYTHGVLYIQKLIPPDKKEHTTSFYLITWD